jgi:hypothetical protein
MFLLSPEPIQLPTVYKLSVDLITVIGTVTFSNLKISKSNYYMMVRLEKSILGLATTSIQIQVVPTSCVWLPASHPSVVTSELSILASTVPPLTLDALNRQKDSEHSREVQKPGRERRRLELSRCKGSVVS